jgi:hypothetical protein
MAEVTKEELQEHAAAMKIEGLLRERWPGAEINVSLQSGYETSHGGEQLMIDYKQPGPATWLVREAYEEILRDNPEIKQAFTDRRYFSNQVERDDFVMPAVVQDTLYMDPWERASLDSCAEMTRADQGIDGGIGY